MSAGLLTAHLRAPRARVLAITHRVCHPDAHPMNVIFAAPILSENAMRVITAATRLDGVRLGVITQDPAEKLGGVAASRSTGASTTS